MLAGVEFDSVRLALKRERKKRIGARQKLEERSGISEGTIYKIEEGWVDPRTGKPYMPSADQLLRLITAMPGLSVTAFFATVEGAAAREMSKAARVAIQREAQKFGEKLGQDLASFVNTHGLSALPDESRRAHSPAVRTKSAPTPHRRSGPRKTGT